MCVFVQASERVSLGWIHYAGINRVGVGRRDIDFRTWNSMNISIHNMVEVKTFK